MGVADAGSAPDPLRGARVITFSAIGRLGGLGNQMFQYAALLGASAKTGHPFAFDPDAGDLARGFLLSPAPRPSGEPLARYEEPGFVFHPGIFEVEDGTDLHGFFQSERYFEHVADRVRHDFSFRPEWWERASEMLAPFRGAGPLVAVGVRRGDYLRYPDLHPVQPAEYMLRAMARFARDGASTFLVFSDDVPWCRENLAGEGVAVMDEADPFVHMAAASRCDHFVIPNSTFAWWGAWLGANPAKRVVGPRRWFGPGYAHLDTRDVLPERWEAI